LQSCPAQPRAAALQAAAARRLAENPFDPKLKLFVTWQALRFRQEHSYFFRHGQYVPIAAEGPKADHVCAFAWRWKPAEEAPPQHVVVAVPRWLARLAQSGESGSERATAPVGELTWGDTRLALPDSVTAPLRNLYTGRRFPPNGPARKMANILADFPVALLTDQD
jgi:(1->4)-alpha-D-glucan 1-alpha-D-glucosylmutase